MHIAQCGCQARRCLDGGSTDLGGGWLKGLRAGGRPASAETINRSLLLTDGLANRGITDPAHLAHHAAELRALGIVTSTRGRGLRREPAWRDVGRGRRPLLLHRARGAIPDCLTGELGKRRRSSRATGCCEYAATYNVIGMRDPTGKARRRSKQ
jgi:hypothetical protein